MNFQVFDNWHPDAVQIRHIGLHARYPVSGNFPGHRTEPYLPLWNFARFFLQKNGYRIRFWPRDYNAAFQFCTEGARTWVHSDTTEYAGVWFLTPNELCPEGHGTAFFKHRETGAIRREGEQDPEGGYSAFEQCMVVEGFFNRLLVYDARLFHCSAIPGWGSGTEDGRLTMTFFWS